jgi:hypothetical protein
MPNLSRGKLRFRSPASAGFKRKASLSFASFRWLQEESFAFVRQLPLASRALQQK